MRFHNWKISWKYSPPGSNKYYNQIKRKLNKQMERNPIHATLPLYTILMGFITSLIMFITDTALSVVTTLLWAVLDIGFMIGHLLLLGTLLISTFLFKKHVLTYSTKFNVFIPSIPHDELNNFQTQYTRENVFSIMSLIHNNNNHFSLYLLQNTKNALIYSGQATNTMIRMSFIKCKYCLWFVFDFFCMVAVLFILYILSAIRLFTTKKSTKVGTRWATTFMELHYSPIIFIPPILTTDQLHYLFDWILYVIMVSIVGIMHFIFIYNATGYHTQQNVHLSVIHFICKWLKRGIAPMFIKDHPNPNPQYMSLDEFARQKSAKRRQRYQLQKAKKIKQEQR